jgi:hypothetical protein
MEQIKRYPSVASLARDAQAVNPFHLSLSGLGGAYFGHETAADSIAKAISGDPARVADAERLLSQISAEIDVPERPWIADCAGAYAVVPDFLAGMPDCMRRRDTVEQDESPVRILCSVAASMTLDADTLMRRGCAVLALVIALSRIRPVELSVYCAVADDDAESVIVAAINTQPLDLATAAYALTSAGFARRLCYNLSRHHHFGRKRCGLSFAPAADDALRATADLVIGAARASDPMIDQPVAWVNEQIAKLREIRQ